MHELLAVVCVLCASSEMLDLVTACSGVMQALALAAVACGSAC